MTGTADSNTVPGDWYATAFGPLYPVLYAHRDAASARREAAFAAECLQLDTPHRVLDLCCGNGRHLVHLSARTPHAVGIDFSPQLLTIARRTLPRSVPLLRADMRALPFQAAFDAVFSFFTSFGYFVDEAENAAAARALANALKPGGRFFLDHLNATHVTKTLVPRSGRDQGEYHIAEERWIDPVARRVNKRTSVTRRGEPIGETTESVRMYAEEELTAILRDAGLEIDTVFGDYDGEPPDAERPRMILTGHRTHTNAQSL